ncbi:response regulator transcription factor [Clostridium oryzae]|uniref:Stage 0 sporulation protein A homolog n=1 Tax=Clostridium oryzae TaxID=1450648 RepID=A0A1V4IU77_9CLOT|nr:response regulator [Clostridium oryzae]OPJ63453.1 putative response regulatory protein [Clostridium oryzae]
MYNVLIADDNNITRKSIMLTIDWSSLGCKVIADSDNGIDALELTKKYIPDIIITDIRMPAMDGLKFTEEVKNLFPWVKVIIITGYNEFLYAQKAIKLGAFDLILKPIDNNELCEVIKRATSVLDEHKEEQYEKEYMKSTIANSKEQVVAKMIIDSIAGIKITDTYKLLQTQKRFFMFTIRYKSNCKETEDDNFRSFIEGAEQAVKALRTYFDYAFIYFWLNNYFTVVVTESNRKPSNRMSDNILKICNHFVEKSSLINRHDYIIGVSKVHTNYDEIKNAYNQTLDAINFSFFLPNKKIVMGDSIKIQGVFNEYALMKKVYGSIKNTYIQKIDKGLDEIHEILLKETPSILAVKNLLSNICFVVLECFYNDKLYQSYNYKSHAEINDDINDIDNLEDAILYVKNFVKNIKAGLNNDYQPNYSKVTINVINYLHDHYDKKISLQEIADYVCLTPTHLCRVIKKDTGESFVDLFNKIKIGVAEKLLKESNLKVYEVANRVGIDNYSYFYKLFKKYTGTVPTEYYNKSS